MHPSLFPVPAPAPNSACRTTSASPAAPPQDLTADAVIAHLDLEPLPLEGGFFRVSYRSTACLSDGSPLASAIYFLLTPEGFSALHQLTSDELWHAYAGDPVEHLTLDPATGHGSRHLLHHGLSPGSQPQLTVRAGHWQGARLVPGGHWALFGCTVSPGWTGACFSLGDRAHLHEQFPAWRELITALSRPGAAPTLAPDSPTLIPPCPSPISA